MRGIFIFTSLIMAVALVFSQAKAEPNMRPGQWEITSTMEMPGMAFSMPDIKSKQCITREDLVPKNEEQDKECKMQEIKVSGDTVTWTVKCDSPGEKMLSKGKIVYHGDTFEGAVITTSDQMPLGMRQKMAGKRLGGCK